MPEVLHMPSPYSLSTSLRRAAAQAHALAFAICMQGTGYALEQPTPSAHHPTTLTATASRAGLGEPLSTQELAAFDITIFPDGRGLPPGQGSVAQGRALYATHCAACHGESGTEGPAARLVGSDGFIGWNDLLRPLRIAKHPLLVQSVGARWPYATTLFDYIRRAMPYQAPKSLESDEVYALSAYLLYRNDLLDEGASLDATTLPKVVMPGARKTVMEEQ